MEATEKKQIKRTFIRIGRDLNSAPAFQRVQNTCYVSKVKFPLSVKKPVHYCVGKDGLTFRCHSKFACAALIFHVIVIIATIYRLFHK